MSGFFYILASKRNGTLYIGVTNNLARRTYEHKEGLAEGFTSDHKVYMLVYCEFYERIEDAIVREKRVKD